SFLRGDGKESSKSEMRALDGRVLESPVLRGVATFASIAKCADQHTCRPIAAWSARPVIDGLGKTFGVVAGPGAGEDAASLVAASRPRGNPDLKLTTRIAPPAATAFARVC